MPKKRKSGHVVTQYRWKSLGLNRYGGKTKKRSRAVVMTFGASYLKMFGLKLCVKSGNDHTVQSKILSDTKS